MFDFTSSKLLILGIVALLVIGPKDLPALLRTIGKYIGIIKRQAAEFRAQFDEAMRESELAELKKEVESIQNETETAMRETERSVEAQLAEARSEVDTALSDPKPVDAPEPGGDAAAELPAPAAEAGGDPRPTLNGTSHPDQPSTAEAGRTHEKSGV
jgi:sec-independent protein translocase protein TatB